MKKLLAMLLILCMLTPLAANAEVWAKLNQKIATRTGPDTKYNEPGTFLRSGDYVLVRSKVWDDRNDIWWVQVEFTPSGYNGEKIRAYTGAKRMNVDLSKVPTEYALRSCRVVRDADGFAGPWYDGFVAWSDTIYAGTSATLLEVENGFAHIECWNSWRGCWWRGWVKLDTLDCASSYSSYGYYGFADDTPSYSGGSYGGSSSGGSSSSGGGYSQPGTTRAPSTYYGNTSGYPVGRTVTIVTSSANARSGPGTQYREVGTVMRYETFKVLACSAGNTEKDWYKIHLGAPYNTDAWISSGVCSIN